MDGSKELINVLGLGKTLKNYTPNSTPTIGVNNICQQVQTDYLVLQKAPYQIDFNTLCNINGFKPRSTVFTPHRSWSSSFEDINIIRLVPFSLSIIDDDVNKFNIWEVPSSLDSTFLACVIAYRLGYKNIITHGVDFNTHEKHLKQLPVILKQYEYLKIKLQAKGVNLFCSSKESQLSKVLETRIL